MPDLLLELFSEEIPARMQARAADDLKRLVTEGLVGAGLTYAAAGAFATPRRLVLTLEGLSAHSPTTREERRGPRTDAPEQAIEGFLRGAGLSRDQLEARADKKGEVFFAVIERAGRPAAEIIAEVVPQVIRDFPWPKSMRWGAGTLRWVRPLQSILCILSDEAGSDIVPFDVDGIASGNTTEGHRFMAPARFAVTHFDDYAAKLKRAHVMLSASERAEHIRHDAEQMAFAAGLELVDDPGLLAEVAGLVEWPVVLMGTIEDRFLDLPAEVLQTSMREHQKFFSVRNSKTGRIERFVTVANVETADHGATILKGNQKVLSARLSDAAFFWENDLRVARAGMQDWLDGLAKVTFHAKLGSQADRIARIAALAREIAPMVGADADQAAEAARIAKADLRSEMVGEFPELQGVMGRYSALAAGRAPEVADACRDHWKPMGAGDDVPTAPVSLAVALADKIDTLTGFWAIDEKPTGSKDPYALRRAALGVVRMVLENGVRVGLGPIADAAFAAHRDDATSEATSLEAFFHDRLKVHLKDEGIRHDIIDAALAKPPADDLFLVVARARALAAFLATPDGENLVQGYRRAANILHQAESADGVEYRYGADVKFAETAEEKALFSALATVEAAIKPALGAEDFAGAMTQMAALRAPIDAFFEAVQVNAENQIVRRNRLNLLHRIVETCGAVADLSKLEG
ncbi:glycine--tRNA ligase subunit beta [Roseicyclus sp.]|uniref:glycine--tRNA ligase subunit beta n=1 Tax=Roseicyclus sp. TaxID=1914329 RepID=UPI003F6C148B